MNIIPTFPNGKMKAFTLSYDDGVTQDIQFVQLLNQYDLKCTFNLNSQLQEEQFQWKSGEYIIRRMSVEETKMVYEGHEIAAHTLTHPHLEELEEVHIREEIVSDIKAHEERYNQNIIGFGYPFGTYDERVVQIAREVGLQYARTVEDTETCHLPEDFLLWHPTCRHAHPNIEMLINSFLEATPSDMSVFLLWGHSYEFDLNDNWEWWAYVCEKISRKPDIWYATNGEIVQYVHATRQLEVDEERQTVYNPTAHTVFFKEGNDVYELLPGQSWNKE